MGATEGFLKGEIKTLVDKLRDKEEEIKQLEIDKIHWRDLYWEECEKNKKLKECYIKLSKIADTTGGYKAKYVNELRDKITMLEEENKSLEAELDKLKSTYVYDAKQVRDVC